MGSKMDMYSHRKCSESLRYSLISSVSYYTVQQVSMEVHILFPTEHLKTGLNELKVRLQDT